MEFIPYVNMNTVDYICQGTNVKKEACERGYRAGYLQGKIDGIKQAEELFKPVEDALKNVRTVVGGSDDN